MSESRGFWSRVSLHYGLNKNYGFHPICALKRALRLVWKTHWPIPDGGRSLHWMDWPECRK